MTEGEQKFMLGNVWAAASYAANDVFSAAVCLALGVVYFVAAFRRPKG